jgi:hypothetical protein
MNELEKQLEEQIKKAVAEAIAKAMPVDRTGVGSRNVVGGEPEPTLESDPATYLLKRSREVKSTDDWTDDEKAVISGLWNKYMTWDMAFSGDER